MKPPDPTVDSTGAPIDMTRRDTHLDADRGATHDAACRATVERLYAAFARLDATTMASCYAESAQFDDPAFSLQGRDAIAAMWAMLCEGAKRQGAAHWRLDVSGIAASGGRGRAHWEPHYRFGATGRPVHNVIDAELAFDAHALIVRHTDRFDFHRWARQALGPVGWLLGWTPWLRGRVRAQAARQLQRHRGVAAGSGR